MRCWDLLTHVPAAVVRRLTTTAPRVHHNVHRYAGSRWHSLPVRHWHLHDWWHAARVCVPAVVSGLLIVGAPVVGPRLVGGPVAVRAPAIVAIPEPSGLIGFVVGLAGLALVRRRS